MNETAIKNYAVWARRELLSEVAVAARRWGVLEQGSPAPDEGVIDGRVISDSQRRQRAELLRMAADEGYGHLIDRAAYTWFNRLVAIRYMEVNDRLASHVRVLSAPDGSFAPECLKEALDLPLDALNQDSALVLVRKGDDEGLFRLVFLAQCSELALSMPDVFEPVGSALELLLPGGLLRADGVVGRLVADIPEADWTEGVEIVGWMYQYYVSERKDEVFASIKKGKKAERDAIAPATQLFTPHWIVRYLTENSLGRLWMLNHPKSALAKQMDYYIKPDEGAEPFRRIASPEDITVVDPACGSGHILTYAFDLLASMYQEAGYSARDAARCILENNLVGLEIDPRAAALSSFALTMKACELDPRFLRRGVRPRVTLLERVKLSEEELAVCPNVARRKALVDAAAHLDECGSLFCPSPEDLAAIDADLAALAGQASLFAGSAASKLERLRTALRPLAAQYDVVVANPPYMGSSSLNKWQAVWVKKSYPTTYRDLCTCFIERGFAFNGTLGYSALVTMQSWMFLGSFEKLRTSILEDHSIVSMAHLGTRAFGSIGGEVVSTTATVFGNEHSDAEATYLRLVDMGSEEEKKAGIRTSIANPTCGWFYRRTADTFKSIPGTPIAYWASDAMLQLFSSSSITQFGKAYEGIKTGDNDRFHRFWFEVSANKTNIFDGITTSKWHRTAKAGEYRKWFGSHYIVTNFEDNGKEMLSTGHASVVKGEPLRKQAITWNRIGTDNIAFRSLPSGFISNMGGLCFYSDDCDNLMWILAFLNSSVSNFELNILNPSMSYPPGTINSLACKPIKELSIVSISSISDHNIEISKHNWDSFEVSWNFRCHPLCR